MGSRTWVCVGLSLVAAGGMRGQQAAGQAVIDKSSERAVFFSGSVMLEDGSVPADPVRLDRVCDGRALFEAWTDDRGHFGFKVGSGDTSAMSGDASLPGARPADVNKAMNSSSTQYSMPITSMLKNCELQAVLSGYQSEPVRLDIKSTMDDARLGTMILHPLSRASALTVSTTSLAAPSTAKKAYQRGLEAMRIQKWDMAASEFGKAVKSYPPYAVAWYQLGLSRQSQNNLAGAIEAWKQAQAADPKYVKPYENLTAVADRQGQWTESEKYSRLWIQLDPEDFPGAYLFNAVANARLNKPEEAERAVREGLRLDKDQKIPRMNYVLGLILMDKKQYGESAKCFRKYLELAPNASDAAIVRQQLPKIEEMAAAPQR